MAVDISGEWVRRLIANPVMAAEVILGIKFDVFQAALFRYMWFCPYFLDDSGVSTGKSERLFACACLRAILLENPPGMKKRVTAIYYWSMSTTEEVIIPKFDHYLATSKLFRDQFLRGHGGKHKMRLEGAYQYLLRNGNKIQLPAGDFGRDSKSQASKRFNDLYVDENKEIDARSDGINKMLLDRATAASYNQDHPIWANHICLMGHAEDRFTHPSWRRNKASRVEIWDGSQHDVIVSSNYRDFSPDFAKLYRPDKRIRKAKLELDSSHFEQQWLGLWAAGTANWYSVDARQRCFVDGLLPEDKRSDDDEIIALGWDTAAGMSGKADWNAGTVMAVKQVDSSFSECEGARVVRIQDSEGQDTYWRFRVIYAIGLFNMTGDQLSGLIHTLHSLFGFSVICLDPQGGGDWVYKKLRDKKQLVGGEWKDAGGLCTAEDHHLYPWCDPVVARYGRSSSLLDAIWETRERTGDDGPVHRSHHELRKAFDTRGIMWPPSLNSRSVEERAAMTPELMAINKTLDDFWSQLGEIKVVVDNKTKFPKPTARGFFSFESSGKKDGAYSVMYSYMGLLALILGGGLTASEDDGDECVVFS